MPALHQDLRAPFTIPGVITIAAVHVHRQDQPPMAKSAS
jgi:hypothetical protein